MAPWILIAAAYQPTTSAGASRARMIASTYGCKASIAPRNMKVVPVRASVRVACQSGLSGSAVTLRSSVTERPSERAAMATFTPRKAIKRTPSSKAPIWSTAPERTAKRVALTTSGIRSWPRRTALKAPALLVRPACTNASR